MTYDHQAWLKERDERSAKKGLTEANIANQTLIALVERRQRLVERTYELFLQNNHDALESALSCIVSLDQAVLTACEALVEAYTPKVNFEWRMAADLPEEGDDVPEDEEEEDGGE